MYVSDVCICTCVGVYNNNNNNNNNTNLPFLTVHEILVCIHIIILLNTWFHNQMMYKVVY